MTINALMTEKHQDILDWCILAGWRGSITHGTYIQKHDPQSIDDKDAMYIVVPPEDYYLGLKQYGSHGTVEIKDGEFDIVVYEAKKFISLLAQGNPNVLCLLWLRPEYYLMQTTAGKMIVENRSLFVGRHVYHSFCGYAKDQLYKMTHFAGRPPTELAYLAGIFDGEGHVSISATAPVKETYAPLYALQVGITNTDHDLIQHLLDEYGGFAGRTGIRDGHRLDAYRWRLAGPIAAKFLRMLHPYLCHYLFSIMFIIKGYNFITQAFFIFCYGHDTFSHKLNTSLTMLPCVLP